MWKCSLLSSCKSYHDSCAQTLITRMDRVCLQLLSWQRKTNTLTSPSSPFLFPSQDNCSPCDVWVCVSGWRERDRFAACLWSSEVTLRVFLELSLISQWQLSPVPELNAGCVQKWTPRWKERVKVKYLDLSRSYRLLGNHSVLKSLVFCGSEKCAEFSAAQSSASHDPSETIQICWFGA